MEKKVVSAEENKIFKKMFWKQCRIVCEEQKLLGK